MKKTSYILILTILITIFSMSATAGDNPKITVIIDELTIQFDVEPYIENGRLLVPVRAITESLGAEVLWDNDTRTVTVKKDQHIIELTIDSLDVKVDGNPQSIDVPAKIKNNRTFVPLRFISENFDAYVHWDSSTRTVTIRQKYASIFDKPINKEYSTIDGRLLLKMPLGAICYEDEQYDGRAAGAAQTSNTITVYGAKDNDFFVFIHQSLSYSTGDLRKDAEIYCNHEDTFDTTYNEYKSKSGITMIVAQTDEKTFISFIKTNDNTLVNVWFQADENIYSQKEEYEKLVYKILDTVRLSDKVLNVTERELIIDDNKKIHIPQGYVLIDDNGSYFERYHIEKVVNVNEPHPFLGFQITDYLSFSERYKDYSASEIVRTKGTILGKPVEWLYYGNSTVDEDSFMQTWLQLDDGRYIHFYVNPTNKENLEELQNILASMSIVNK